jgi:hypothetical protein
MSSINPASGLPMADSCIDVEGDIYGSSINNIEFIEQIKATLKITIPPNNST